MPKINLYCPLCHYVMRQHPAGYFLCRKCKSMFSPYGGPEKAALIKRRMDEHLAKSPKTHAEWLREKVAIKNKSLLLVGPKSWTVHKFKKDGKEGFLCFCQEFKPFDSYVYAHWNERVTHECEKCKAKFAIQGGVVKVTKNPVGEFVK